MSHYFAISVLISHVLVFHKKSKQLIYFKIAPLEDFNPSLVHRIEALVQNEEIQVVLESGEYLEYSLENTPLLLRSGSLCSVVLALNAYPNKKIRETLEEFGNLLDFEWTEELTFLYSKYKGESRIFARPRPPNRPIIQLIEECFHLQYSLPHKLNNPPAEMTEAQAIIWDYGGTLAEDTGFLVLGEFLSKIAAVFPEFRQKAPEIILSFLNQKNLTPIPLKRLLEDSEAR